MAVALEDLREFVLRERTPELRLAILNLRFEIGRDLRRDVVTLLCGQRRFYCGDVAIE